MLRLSSYSVKDATKWLSNHGLSVSGTKHELNNRIQLYQRYPKLVEKYRKRVVYNRTFPCALEYSLIPAITAPWIPDREAWPPVSETVYLSYCTQKREGNVGQQEKAVRMLESRKIVNVKSLQQDSDLFVRALVNPSFGSTPRAAVLLFQNLSPVKGHCECPVGSNGICCHILALLLFLKHYNETGEELLELTCTQQLQKWHKRCRKGSLPMLQLSQIKVKAAKVRQAKGKNNAPQIIPADPDRSYQKRDVPELERKMKKRILDTGIPVMDHFHSILSKSKVGRESSFGGHLCYMFAKNSLQHHEYAESLVDLPPWIKSVPKPDLPQSEVNNNTPSTLVNSIVYQDELPLVVLKNQTLMYLTPDCLQMEAEINSQLENNIVRIDVSMLQAPKPFGSNYVNCIQRSEIWHAIRKNKITGSRLPALLGTYGKPKYEHYWKVVKDSVPEEDLSHIILFHSPSTVMVDPSKVWAPRVYSSVTGIHRWDVYHQFSKNTIGS